MKKQKQQGKKKKAEKKKQQNRQKRLEQHVQIEQQNRQKWTEQQRQTEQQEQLEQQQQIEEQKQLEQQNQTEQQRQIEQQKQLEQQRQIEQQKQLEQQRQTEQQNQLAQQKQIEEQIRLEQVRKQRQLEQQKQLEKLKRKRQQKEQRQKRDWKAYIYNCPYLIAISLTSIAVMFASDEIGISAIARDAQTFVCKSYAKMPGERDALATISNGLMQDDNKNSSDMNNMSDAEEDEDSRNTEEAQAENTLPEGDAADPESGDPVTAAETENAGKRKGESNDLQSEDGQQDEHDIPENGVEPEGVPKGITNFVFYEPTPTDSRYYEDAGKVALTTEYPYAKENIGYFDDAAFLGDSRTLGISDYAGLDEADFYCDSGMTIFKILEEEVTYQKTGSKVLMPEVLQNKKYGKIYIMLGMNELGYGNTEMYLEQYRQVLNQIREWQPEAIIYIMANLHVSEEKNNMETEFNNMNINSKNAASAELANGTDVFYLDVNPVFTDEEGYLNAELTFDGVHLYAKHYDAWREFLLEHAVEPVVKEQP